MCLVWMINYVCDHHHKLDPHPVFCEDYLLGTDACHNCVEIWGFSSNDVCPLCNKFFRTLSNSIMNFGKETLDDSTWRFMRDKNRLLNLWYLRRIYRLHHGDYIEPCDDHVYQVKYDEGIATMIERMWGENSEDYQEAALLQAVEETMRDAKIAIGTLEDDAKFSAGSQFKIALEDFLENAHTNMKYMSITMTKTRIE
ncbi:MAG: hypothetical protein M1835_005543 [Candelina submexicana]|nr:MAG: hypothetical protein M1835_005543 [Candelina submexicana]